MIVGNEIFMLEVHRTLAPPFLLEIPLDVLLHPLRLLDQSSVAVDPNHALALEQVCDAHGQISSIAAYVQTCLPLEKLRLQQVQTRIAPDSGFQDLPDRRIHCTCFPIAVVTVEVAFDRCEVVRPVVEDRSCRFQSRRVDSPSTRPYLVLSVEVAVQRYIPTSPTPCAISERKGRVPQMAGESRAFDRALPEVSGCIRAQLSLPGTGGHGH
mmetsp:Transcript_8410/g.28220  ORF Transcript_8410/g.28220 Transcript_8410/m.28220 type:complete len:211 (+) Transcript_8410:487-1119(+)